MPVYSTNLWRYLENSSCDSLSLSKRSEIAQKIVHEVKKCQDKKGSLCHRDIKVRSWNSFQLSFSAQYFIFEILTSGLKLCQITGSGQRDFKSRPILISVEQALSYGI